MPAESRGEPDPLVSVLIPTYNGERYLDETLLSVRLQTYRNLEVIIRDDGSTDRTVQIAERNAGEDERISVIRSAGNAGAAANFVELAKAASGDYLKFCNQDDLLRPSCVKTLLSSLAAAPRAVLATSRRDIIDHAGNVQPPRMFTTPLADDDAVLPGRELQRDLILGALNRIGEPTTVLYRNGIISAETMLSYGAWTARVNGDVAMWMNLLDAGDAAYVNKTLSSFRLHDRQISSSVRAELLGFLDWADLLDEGFGRGLISVAELTDRLGPTTAALVHGATTAASSGEPGLAATIPEIADISARLIRRLTG